MSSYAEALKRDRATYFRRRMATATALIVLALSATATATALHTLFTAPASTCTTVELSPDALAALNYSGSDGSWTTTDGALIGWALYEDSTIYAPYCTLSNVLANN